MKRYRPKTSALIIISVAVIALAAGLTAFTAVYLSRYKIIMTVLICLFWLAGLLFAAVLLPAYFARTEIFVSLADVSMHTGIVFVKHCHMRIGAVQYVTSIKTFLSKYTGFNFLILRGMGGGMVLPFLRLEDMNEMSDIFSSQLSGR